jgi:hypothetical protein
MIEEPVMNTVPYIQGSSIRIRIEYARDGEGRKVETIKQKLTVCGVPYKSSKLKSITL